MILAIFVSWKLSNPGGIGRKTGDGSTVGETIIVQPEPIPNINMVELGGSPWGGGVQRGESLGYCNLYSGSIFYSLNAFETELQLDSLVTIVVKPGPILLNPQVSQDQFPRVFFLLEVGYSLVHF